MSPQSFQEKARGPTSLKCRTKPRLGFLGLGWIGRHRLDAIVKSGYAEVAAIADAAPEVAQKASPSCPGAEVVSSIEELAARDVDGLAIATPSALHAAQAEYALRNGIAVFCQKPLARSALETREVVSAARISNRLLDVDFSYRHISGVRKIKELCAAGELGEIYAADLVFHNAYGPDKPWFYDPNLSGGGCLIDLGIHLVDLGLWMMGFPEVVHTTGRLFSQGRILNDRACAVEDYAEARLDLANGASIRLACSWKLQAGRDAVIGGAFYGTKGGASFRNVNGSFFDFEAEQYRGTTRTVLCNHPEEWGGRGAVEWARRLSQTAAYDPEAERTVEVAAALDSIYESQLIRQNIPLKINVVSPCPA